MFILILSILNILCLDSSEVYLVENIQKIHLKNSNGNSNNIIVFFNQSSYNPTVKNRFVEYYEGIIKTEWNNQFSSISGFAGIMANETNIKLYQQEFPEANIETDEIIKAQMNYATLQSKAVNSTWGINGYKGDTDASVAVLDTGVNSNHNFLSGSIIGWENFVNTDPISDDNGHGTFISSVITGATKIEHIEQNVQASGVKLSKNQLEKISKILDNEPTYRYKYIPEMKIDRDSKLSRVI